MIRLTHKMFSGAANIHNGTLQRILEGLAGDVGKTAAAAVADLTDNSGGAAADGVIAAIPLPVRIAGVGPAKAATETAFGTLKDALTELAAQVVLVQAKVPAVSAVNSLGGTTADGTIAAITKNLADTTTPFLNGAGAVTFATNARNHIATLTHLVNQLARATGVAPVVDNSGGTPKLKDASGANLTLAALSTDTGTATTGVDATTNSTCSAATTNAFLTASANAVKELATKLNAITSDTVRAPSVVLG